MATSRLFRSLVAGLYGHISFSSPRRALWPHLDHKASKLPIKRSSRVAVKRDYKMSTGPRQAMAKLCAARPLRFYWQPLVGALELSVGDFLIKSVHNLRKHIKNLVFSDIRLLPADSSKPISGFSTHFAAEGRTFFLKMHFFKKYWWPSRAILVPAAG